MVSVFEHFLFIRRAPLYQGASMFIKQTIKIGLIGLTDAENLLLLRIINGDLKWMKAVSAIKDCTIGFLNQDLLSYQSEDAIHRRYGGVSRKRWIHNDRLKRSFINGDRIRDDLSIN